MCENKYALKLDFDRCAKINTRKINRCPMREIESARKLVRIMLFMDLMDQMELVMVPHMAQEHVLQ